MDDFRKKHVCYNLDGFQVVCGFDIDMFAVCSTYLFSYPQPCVSCTSYRKQWLLAGAIILELVLVPYAGAGLRCIDKLGLKASEA